MNNIKSLKFERDRQFSDAPSNTPEWSRQGQSGQLSTQTADQLTMTASTHTIINWRLLATMD